MADRVLRFVAVLALLLGFLPGAAQAQQRLALVVGNGAYSSVTALDNPVGDARLLATALESKGFDVTLVLDADQAEMNRAISAFGRSLREAGPEATGLFYYAGHGVQSFGSNYLLPTDASLTDAADLGLVGVPADAVLRQMASARNSTNIVILDACRNNPFESIPDMNDNGLAEMKAPTGTFLAYSTAPGAVALDGLDGNSPFTQALAVEIASQGVPIEQVFKAVRVKVLETTSGAQTPWDTSSLTQQFFFTPAAVVSPQDVAAKQLWDSVKDMNDPIQIMLFLRAYPASPYAEEARKALSTAMNQVLTPDADPSAAAVPPAAAQPATPDTRESALIEVARASGQAADYHAYLDAFPTGIYAELAKFELSTLAARTAAPPPIAPVVSAPAPSTAEQATLTFTTALTVGGENVAGKSIEQLAKSSPLFAPIDGLPEELWKGQTCSNCHAWTQSALCDQGKTYLAQSGERALSKQHPFGGPFKRALRVWAGGGCQ
ncbi:MAG: caspase family protein [Gemmobacter sp.]|nr:caspase family protein [Gemmobacter sp.]